MRLDTMRKLGETIENPEEVQFDINEVLVIGILNNIMSIKELKKENNDFPEFSEYPTFISLKDISNLYPDGCYKVINETTLGGEIFRYNNYGKKEWIKIGEMYGYA